MARKFVSSTVFISFLILFLSSFVLYIIPGGRVGVAEWSFMSLKWMDWVNLHIISGILFLAFSLWHTVLNWKSLVSIFRKAASFNAKSLWPLAGAVVLNVFIVMGTLGNFQPLETVISFYKQTKQEFRSGAKKVAERPGEQISTAAETATSGSSSVVAVSEIGEGASFRRLVESLPSAE